MEVEIAGKKYNLKADNEKLLRLSAELVNSEMMALASALPNESQNTVAVLAALNIAEKYFSANSQMELDKEFMKSQLEQMDKQLQEQMLVP